MKIILGKKYLSTKEVSNRYGFSTKWFEKERYCKRGPVFIKLNQRGRVFYPMDETDQWFKENLKEA